MAEGLRYPITHAAERGNFLEQIAAKLLRKQRYEVQEQLRVTGMEIDLLGEHIDTRMRALVECKFRLANVSAPILNEAIGKAYNRDIATVYVFSSSPLTKDAKGLLDDNRRDTSKKIRLAFVGPEDLVSMFKDVEGISEPHISPDLVEAYGDPVATSFLINNDASTYWAVEMGHGGIPSSLVLFPTTDSNSVPLSQLKKDFDRLEYWLGLGVALGRDVSNSSRPPEVPFVEDELVSLVTSADRFDDYRPSRPEDFVGRESTQQAVWSFLEDVRRRRTNTRILALSGPSGFGKSSVVLKLSHRFTNRRWKKTNFIYPVDSRSAKGPLFVLKASGQICLAVRRPM